MTQNELENGETLQHGKYEILSLLGKGGFGITYLAEHSVLKKKVAIKELFLSTQSVFCSRKEDDSKTVRPHFQEQDFETFKDKFLTEASTLARFTGRKGIVQISDTFPENNTVYFVMDYIDGYSVKEMVHQKGMLSEKEAIDYVLQVLYALKEVHAVDILHRDIKPDNLIIRKQDQQVILIDFGIAREFSENETQTQTAMISVGYAPPEQKLTKAKRSQSMDLYSAGAVLYFCLTANRPQTTDEIMSNDYISAKD
jgi:serine/threonine-protein kinase